MITGAQIDIHNMRVKPWVMVASLVLLLFVFEYTVKNVFAQSSMELEMAGTVPFQGGGSSGTGNGFVTNINSLLASIGTFIQASMATANAKAQLLIPDGQSLLIAIAGMMLAWNAVLWILGGSLEDIMKSFITFILMWGLAKYALDNYGTLTTTIASGFDYIANKLGVDPHNFFLTLFKSAFAPLEAVAKVLENTSVMPWADNFLSIIAMAVLAGIVSIVIFIVGAVVMATIAISQVLFAIAVVLGPVLIPFMLLPFLSGLATGWLNYLIYAGFVKVVGVVLIVFISGFTHNLANMDYTSGTGLNLGAYVGATLISILVAFLALMIMEITSGIVGGSPLRGVVNSGTRVASGTAGKIGSAGRGLKDRMLGKSKAK